MIRIEGMTCASCVARAEAALARVDGVASVSVNLATEQARVTYQQGFEAQPAVLAQALSSAGFRLQQVVGATPPAASEAAELHLPAGGKGTTLGRVVHFKDPSFLGLVLAVVLSVPLVVPMLLGPLGMAWHPSPWLQFVLATPVQFVLGARFYRGAWAALKARSGNMDLLVALGTTAAWCLSTWLLVTFSLLTPPSVSNSMAQAEPHLYFESSAVVITLVLLGKHLERRAKRSTVEAIRALSNLMPARARKWTGAEPAFEWIDTAQLVPGDRVEVLPGESIPCDGIVEGGSSSVDESLLTGESEPVTRSAGGRVTGGSLNLDGRLIVVATAVGAESTVARMARLVEEAQLAKAPIQHLVDRVSAFFVPFVVGVAALTVLSWLAVNGDLQHAILCGVAVLVIACPCALGLATPATIMVGTGRAARLGILIKDAEALEGAHHVGTVVFDKTGTLTEGRPELRTIVSGPRSSLGLQATDSDALLLAAALQSGSEHPLGRALVAEARQRGLSWQTAADLRVLPGLGIQGTVTGRTLVMGSARLLEQHATVQAVETFFREANHTPDETGLTWAFLADPAEGHLLAAFGFADRPKPTAKAAVARLQSLGIAVRLLSGDRPAITARIAEELGIGAWDAGVLPADKAALVARLCREATPKEEQHQRIPRLWGLLAARGAQAKQRLHHRVAMVGDGLNDAPALAAADVSFAMAGGTDVARHAAHVTLMRGDPRLVAVAIELSRQTHRKIVQNLFWAFVYNVLGIPLAALGLLSPVVAGAAMALSSVCVLANALALRRFEAHGLAEPESRATQPRSPGRFE